MKIRNVLRRIKTTMFQYKQDTIAYQAYIKLNNLYLAIEAGQKELNRGNYNLLNQYLISSEAPSDPLYNYWIDEFRKLPGWLNV